MKYKKLIFLLFILFLNACTPLARLIDPCSELNESKFIEDSKRIDGYYPDPPNNAKIIIFDGNYIDKSPPEYILARVEPIKVKSPPPSVNDIIDQIMFPASPSIRQVCNTMFDPNQPNLSRPIISAPEDQSIEPLDGFHALVCGWNDPALLSVTLVYPDGTKAASQIKTDSSFANQQSFRTVYGTRIFFLPTLDSPYGEYKFLIDDGIDILEANFNVIAPTGPRIRNRYVGDWRTLLLYNFKQNEEVKIFEYNWMDDESYCFVGWQTYQTDARGRLEIYLNNLTRFERFIAIGSSSGEVSEIDPSILKASQ